MQQFYLRINLLWTLTVLTVFTASAQTPSAVGEVYETTQLLKLPPLLDNPSGCSIGLPINDFSCNNSHLFNINVTNAPGSALGTDVFLKEVRLIIFHEWDADLDMFLISPAGVEVELSTDNGSGNDHYGNPLNGLCDEFTALISHATEEACDALSISQGHSPFIGTFLPEGNLNDFNTGDNPNGTWTLKICDDGKEHYGTLEFVELVFEATLCLPPSSVTIVSVDSTSVILDWTPGSNCDSTIIEYGLPGFTPGADYNENEGVIFLTSCPPVTLTGLVPASEFELYVRESCGNGVFSTNSCPISFTTKCSPPPATILEDFNSQDLCTPICGFSCDVSGTWTNAQNDDFDWIVNEGPVSTAQTGPGDDFPGGGRYVYIETSGTSCRNGRKGVLISNCIEVQANADSCDMSFNYCMNGVHVNSLALEVTTNGGMTWLPIWQETGNKGQEWHKKFIDLDAFEGQVVQFRFTGRGGSGARGDIALDNIVFYGSTDLGAPSFIYYKDEDGDGFGQPGIFISSCESAFFPGFVSNSDDCDDSDPFLNPLMPETPCDGIDINCNGMDDEFFLPPPFATGDTVCSGETGAVSAIADFGGEIHWYDAETGGNLLFTGEIFTPSLPPNHSSDAVSFTFYAEEETPNGCTSTSRQASTITILPLPNISTGDTPEICAGETFDLSSVDVLDLNSANGVFSYYADQPFTPANQIDSLVQPFQTTAYFIVSTGDGGCTDFASVTVTVKPSPIAVIAGDSTICRNASDTITVSDEGNGLLPLAYEWNTGDTLPTLPIFSNVNVGASNFYSVTITGSNGCTSVDSLHVTTVVNISAVQTSAQPVTTCNGSNGSIAVSPLDGTGPFTYQWTGGNSSIQPGGLTINNLSQGAYSFTITDSSPEGCPFYLPVVVVNGPSAAVTLEDVDNASCFGGADGCIEIDVLGNNPSILWSNGITSELNCGLTAGNYTVTVTDGPCSNVLTIPVTQPEPIIASTSVKDISCFGGANGQISLTSFGGTPPYQYLWSNGQQTSSIGNLTAGSYSATITDAHGCELHLPGISVKQPDPLSIDTLEWRQVSCFGGSDGKITVTATGGRQPYSFAWSNGGAGSTITNLVTGLYIVTLTDANGCTASVSFNLPQSSPVEVQFTQVQNPVCDGIDNGSIQISAAGGNSGYSFLWSNGMSTNDISGLAPGDYWVTVTDQLGCTVVSNTATLIGPENFQLEFEIVNPACVGIENGYIEATVLAGGSPPYDFNWSTDDSGPVLTDLPPGSYTLSITDSNGCRADTTIELEEKQPLDAVYNAIPPACHGSASGQLSLIVNGGVQPHDILWSTGEHGNSISGLVAANYTATITDAAGCKLYLDLIPLDQPEPLEIYLENLEGVVCSGGSGGNIDVTVVGGTLPYQFHWSNATTTEDLTNLMAGTYTITVTDEHSCVTVSQSFEIVSPNPIVPSVDLLANSGCQELQVDSVCVSVEGGVAPYDFLWNNGDTGSCLKDVPVGDYVVTITDAAGCTQELMSVKVPEKLSPVSVEIVMPSQQEICAGTSNGALTVAVQGGTKPYQFIWSNGAFGITLEDTLHLQGLNGNFYNVTITDNHGCTAVSDWLPVISYAPLLLSVPGTQIQHVKCKGGQNGAINLNVTGGLLPYQFQWKNAVGNVISTNEDLTNLPAGTYMVTVTDSLGCNATASAQVNEPAQFLGIFSTPPVVADVSCFGLQDGLINITTSGGVPPYSFNWSNGMHTEDLQNLGPGIYTLTITDANNCSYISAPFTIISPEGPLVLQNAEITGVSCFGGNDGEIDVTVSGGTPGYYFSWNPPSTDEDLFNLISGEYQLTVLDSHLCALDTTFFVTEPPELQVVATATSTTSGQDTGTATSEATGGTPPYQFLWNGELSGDSLSSLGPGWYQVVVTDDNSCTDTAWVQVTIFDKTFEGSSVSKVSLFPNPTSGQATLFVETTEPAELEITVINPIGQAIFSKQMSPAQQSSIPVDLQNQPPGVYWVVLRAEGRRIYTGRLVVFR